VLTNVSSRRLLGVLLVAALPFVAACGAGEGSGTEKIQPRPYAGSADAGALKVRAVRIVPASFVSSSDAQAAQAYLTLSIVNTGTESDTLTNATVEGSTVTPGGPAGSFRIDPQKTLQFGTPDLGHTGATLEISGLTEELRVGTAVAVTVSFQNAGSVSMDAPVYDSDFVGSTSTAEPIETTGSYPSASAEPAE
jgi:copper(I)-binding protein